VLVGVALAQNEDEFERTAAVVAPVLSAADRTTLAGRQAALRDLCRTGAEANLEAMRESTNWPLWISVWGLAAGREPLAYRNEIEAALVTGYESFNERIEAIYTAVIAFLGLRIRPPFTLRQFTVAADSLGQGFGLRDRVDGYYNTVVVRPTGPDGQEQEWTVFAVAFEALVNQFFEFDPDG
jgi:hypothetical protein